MWPFSSSGRIVRMQREDVPATLLFCDLKGFAQAAERLTAAQVADGLDDYLSAVVASLDAHRGTVANVIGDAVLAYWLADVHPDHAALACRFAASLPARLSPSHRTQISIHSGPIALVRVSAQRRSFLTPIGDAVNTASRLNAVCTHFETRALATGAVIAAAPGEARHWQAVEPLVIKGKVDPLPVYRIAPSGPA